MSFKLVKSILFLALLTFACKISFASANHLYCTWDVLEVDTCASSWLIKNFVDKQAEFRFFPKGELITEGTAFDTPDAELRRTGNMSTFEAILGKYKIEDKVILEIGRIIHDIEINFWQTNSEAQALNQEVLTIINQSKTPQDALEKSFLVFERLYKALNNSNTK